MNILRDKSPAQRGYFKNSVADLLLALRFLGGLYNFCNFLIKGLRQPDILIF